MQAAVVPLWAWPHLARADGAGTAYRGFCNAMAVERMRYHLPVLGRYHGLSTRLYTRPAVYPGFWLRDGGDRRLCIEGPGHPARQPGDGVLHAAGIDGGDHPAVLCAGRPFQFL